MLFTDYEKNELSNALIYPNPVMDELTVELSGFTETLQVKIINLQGQTIYDERFENTSKFELEVEWLKSGAYIMEIMHGNESSRLPFIKN